MKKTLLFLFFYMPISLFSQTPVFEWAVQQEGGEIVDRGRGIVTDNLGNIYITGTEDTGDTDIFVSKFNPNGELLWTYSLGNNENDHGLGIATDSFGNVYITGNFEGNVDFDPGPETHQLTSGDNNDVFVLKLDTNGYFLWATNMGGDGSQSGKAIALDESNNIYITGYLNDTADFDPGSEVYNLSSNGDTDVFIAKLNSEGEFIWAKSLGGTLSDMSNSITLDEFSNIYITGYFAGTVDFDPGPGLFNQTALGLQDLFVLKLNNDGVFIWAKCVGGNSAYLNGYGVQIDENGNSYIVGRYFGTVDFNPGLDTFNLLGTSAIFILKLDTNGDYLWVQSINNALPSELHGMPIVLDETNDIYITGRFSNTVDFDPGPGIYNLTSLMGNNDVFILKLDQDGLFKWVGLLNGASYNSIVSITLDSWNNIYTLGQFSSTTDFDPDSSIYELTPIGDIDIFIHKMSQQPCEASPMITNTNSSFPICPGDSITLKAELPADVLGFSYSWDTGEVSDSITIAPDSTSSYSVYINYSPSCNDTATIEITVFEIADPTYLAFTTCDSLAVGIEEFIYTDQNGCDSIVIEVNTLIPIPESPNIPADLVIAENAPPFQISIPEVPNASSYEWAVPPGVQILSGAGTNTITINWDDQLTNGSVCVSALNECGSSPEACMEVSVDITDAVNDVVKKAYTIFPNPADEELHVVFEAGESFEIVLLDVLGRVLVPKAGHAGQATLETSLLPEGTYWLKIGCLSGLQDQVVHWERVEIVR